MNSITRFLNERYEEVKPLDFYRGIFPVGELQKKGEYRKKGEKYKYNGILVSVTNRRKSDGRPLIKRYTVTDDLEAIDKACKTDDFSIMSPISYVGKERTSDNSRFLYGVVVDLDHIKVKDCVPIGLRTLIDNHIEKVKRVPAPTYIVSSGTGVHLYYVFEKPVALYEEAARKLQQFKYDLTELIWHETVVDIKSKKDIQQEGIYQGFRVVGTITKTGTRAVAFSYGSKVSLDYLNGFIKNEDHRVTGYKEKGSLTLSEAKEKFPDWYDRRIVKKQTSQKRHAWHVNRAVYEWWKRKIKEGASVGHRYHCMRVLAVYAKKCSFYDSKKNPAPVTRDELEKDMWDLFDYMESLTDSEDNHFTKGDVLDALESFDEKWVYYPIKAIEYRCAISIHKNDKRSGSNGTPKHSQVQHLYLARERKKGMKEIGISFKNLEGRPSKKDIVINWRLVNPSGRKVDCIRDTGLSKPTVYKYWNMEKEEKK